MKREDARVGMRIYVPHSFFGDTEFAGQKGTIVSASKTSELVGVEFDNFIREISPILCGHTCGGKAKNGHGRFGRYSDIQPLGFEACDNIKILFDDVFEGDKT